MFKVHSIDTSQLTPFKVHTLANAAAVDAPFLVRTGIPSFVPKVQLSNFSVTTTSGTILVNWGDGLSDTVSSGVPVNHSFSCPGAPAAPGFWNNIQPCI